MRLATHLSRSTKIFVGLTILYGILTFILPANYITKANYQLSDMQYHYLLFIVRVPIVIVWCLAFYSYRRLHAYTQQIKDTPEGSDFAAITRGMHWIAWGLVIPAIISTLLNAIANQSPDFLKYALIITNYMYLIVSLIAFTYISNGAYRLARRANVYVSLVHIRWFTALLTITGVIFCYFVALRLQGSGMGNTNNGYHLPNLLVWATIAIPYLYAWFIGLFAALELTLLSQRTSGIIYRQALQYLAAGLVLLVVSMCMMQFLRSSIPRVGYLQIGPTLLAAYAMYGLNAAGSILLVIGARRLKRIEDI